MRSGQWWEDAEHPEASVGDRHRQQTVKDSRVPLLESICILELQKTALLDIHCLKHYSLWPEGGAANPPTSYYGLP